MPALQLAAATGADAVIVDLFLVLLAAKVGHEFATRIGQPALFGEVLAGVLVGPAVLGWVELSDVLEAFSEFGVVVLLFWAGLETRLEDMRAVGRSALTVGALGIVVPFAAGMGVGLALGESVTTSLFIASVLMVTSAGITAAVLGELGLLAGTAGRTILGAAVVDDILALVIVGVASSIAGDGDADVLGAVAVGALAIAFVVFFATAGTAALRRRPEALGLPRFADSTFVPAFLLCLGLAALASVIGLAAIVGAFLAGMMVAETRDQHPVEREIAPLYALFPSFFFVFIGASIDLDALAGAGTLLLLAGLTALSFAVKFFACWLAARPLGRQEALMVGLGMTPRGEVGIVIAGLGLASGALDGELFAVLVAVSVITSLLAPPALRRVAKAGGDQSGYQSGYQSERN
jgi:Kef-type K+ transport system membrane component KefB